MKKKLQQQLINILRVKQDANENNETTVNKKESYDKNSVKKDIINLKNDI